MMVPNWMRQIFLLVLALLTVGGGAALATETVSLYRISVPVESESSSQRRAAASDALAQVFVKVAGQSAVLQQYPALQDFLPQASRRVVSYRYHYRQPAAPAPDDETLAHEEPIGSESLFIEFEFQPSFVEQSLRQAGAPVWQARRPVVMSWVVVERGGERNFLSLSALADSQHVLARASADRGLPLRQPLLDLEEVMQVEVDDVWNFEFEMLAPASQRYASTALLVGRVSQSWSGEWFGRWQFQHDDVSESVRYRGGDLAEWLASGVDLAAESLAARFAVSGSAPVGAQRWSLGVSGIESPGDYTAVTKHLRELAVLENLRLARVEGDSAIYHFDTAAAPQQLEALLLLDKRMRLGSGFPGGPMLNFDWRP